MNELNPINKITNQESNEEVVPPPPPHIELLSVVNETNSNKCIYNVISYLDVNSRQVAFTSCTYLRDAVKEYINNNMSVVVVEENTDDTPKVSGGGNKPATAINEQAEELIERETYVSSSEEEEEDVSTSVAELPTEEENDTSRHLLVTKSETPPPTLAELSSESSEPSSSSSTESSVVTAKDQIDDENDIPTSNTPTVPSTPPKKSMTSGDYDQVHESSSSSTPDKSTKRDDKSTKLLISPRSVLQEEDCQTTPEDLPEDKPLPEEAKDDVEEEEEAKVEDISLTSTIPSITTIDLQDQQQQQEQTDTFLSMVSSSGAISLSRTHSHLSVLTSDTGMQQQQQQTPDYIPSATETDDSDTEDVSCTEEDKEQEKKKIGTEKQEDPSPCEQHNNIDTEVIDELSEMQTVSSSTLLQDTPIASPTTPMLNTPDVSVTCAQRLELNMNHIIRDGNKEVPPPMFGCGIHSSMTTVSLGGIMEREVTGNDNLAQSPRPQTQQEEHTASFTRLCDIRNTSMEELPFDERPKHVRSFEDDISEVTPASTIPNTNNTGEQPVEGQNSFDTTSTDDCSADENESSATPAANDVLAQVTDAALFGTGTSVSEVITDMAKSVKSSVNNLVLHKHGRRNQIDDAGPIKIGEKYYSHNEALYLWRKTKIKLKDRHGDIDDEGDVKIEKASFFEKNSIFQEEKADEKKDKSTTTSLDKTDDKLMTLGELISHYEIRPLTVDDASTNTATTGDEKKTSRLMPVSEEQEPAEFRGFDVDNETAETESETNCSAGGVDGSGDDSSMTSDDDNDQSPSADGGVQQRSSWERTTNTNNCETDSVAGSLPSHMGSAYGVEVTSLRGTSGNFINGKGSSEQVKLGSVGKGSCEQSVLGSQYGTEVLFKPSKKKKVSTRRKSRTLTRHNMGIKTASSSGAKGQSSVTTLRQTTKKKSILKLKLGGMKKNARERT